jgi:hypothetical protein
MIQLPETAKFLDGWYWFLGDERNGPFETEDAALNDFVDSHDAPEE